MNRGRESFNSNLISSYRNTIAATALYIFVLKIFAFKLSCVLIGAQTD